MIYRSMYETDHFCDVPIEVLCNEHGWWWARVTAGAVKNLSAFATEPTRAVEALERALIGVALHGTEWCPSSMGEKYQRRIRAQKEAKCAG